MLGVSIMTYELGSLPTVSIALAVTFSLYGAVKNDSPSSIFEHCLGGVAYYTYSSMVCTNSRYYIMVFYWKHDPHRLLLVCSGFTTSVPLILFSYGARLLPLNVLGFLQYLSPTMGFFLAIFYFGESFGTAHLTAFGCIWVALVLFSLSNRITTRINLKQ